MRERLALASQRLMEIADLSYLHAADLVASDERSSHDGIVNVHAEYSLSSKVVAELTSHTRLYCFEMRELDDGTKRALVMLEGDTSPLGWATSITSDGIPLIYMFARPLYEVEKRPLKVRQHFEQTSKYLKQLPAGTRMHILEHRRTMDGAQRVCVVVIGDWEPIGWVTSKKPNGKRTLLEVKGLSNGSGGRRSTSVVMEAGPARSSPSASAGGPSSSKYTHMATEALETAAVEFVSQLGAIIPSSNLAAASDAIGAKAEVLEDKVRPLRTSVLEDGEKPLSVELGEILRERKTDVNQMMRDASSSNTDDRKDGLIDKMEFRMFIRTLLDQNGMLSNAVGANEIDNLFPALDTDGSGSIDMAELKTALVVMDDSVKAHQAQIDVELARAHVYRARVSRIEPVIAATMRAENAVRDREAHLKKSVGNALGTMLLSKGLAVEDVAGLWTRDGPVDKVTFRRETEAMGWKAEVAEIDGLFDRLARSSGGILDKNKLKELLSRLQADAEASVPTIRRLNIEIIESTKALKVIQTDHKQIMHIEDHQEAQAERESQEREAQRAEAKKRAAVAADVNPGGARKGKAGKRKPAPRMDNAHKPKGTEGRAEK